VSSSKHSGVWLPHLNLLPAKSQSGKFGDLRPGVLPKCCSRVRQLFGTRPSSFNQHHNHGTIEGAERAAATLSTTIGSHCWTITCNQSIRDIMQIRRGSPSAAGILLQESQSGNGFRPSSREKIDSSWYTACGLPETTNGHCTVSRSPF